MARASEGEFRHVECGDVALAGVGRLWRVDLGDHAAPGQRRAVFRRPVEPGCRARIVAAGGQRRRHLDLRQVHLQRRQPGGRLRAGRRHRVFLLLPELRRRRRRRLFPARARRLQVIARLPGRQVRAVLRQTVPGRHSHPPIQRGVVQHQGGRALLWSGGQSCLLGGGGGDYRIHALLFLARRPAFQPDHRRCPDAAGGGPAGGGADGGRSRAGGVGIARRQPGFARRRLDVCRAGPGPGTVLWIPRPCDDRSRLRHPAARHAARLPAGRAGVGRLHPAVFGGRLVRPGHGAVR